MPPLLFDHQSHVQKVEQYISKSAQEIKRQLISFAKEKFGNEFPMLVFLVPKPVNKFETTPSEGIYVAHKQYAASKMQPQTFISETRGIIFGKGDVLSGCYDNLIMLPEGLYFFKLGPHANRLPILGSYKEASGIYYIIFGETTLQTMEKTERKGSAMAFV